MALAVVAPVSASASGGPVVPSQAVTTDDTGVVTSIYFAQPGEAAVGTSAIVRAYTTKSSPILEGTTVTLFIDGVVVGSEQTDAEGVAELGFVYPAGGNHAMKMTAGSKFGTKYFGSVVPDAEDAHVTSVSFSDPGAGVAGAYLDETGMGLLNVTATVTTSSPTLSGVFVSLWIDGAVVNSSKTDAYGVTKIHFRYPAAGSHTMKVTAGSVSQSKQFTSLPDTLTGLIFEAPYLPLSGNSGVLTVSTTKGTYKGSSAILSGSTVTVSIDDAVVGSAQTDDAGFAYVDYTVPTAGGSHTMTVTGDSLSLSKPFIVTEPIPGSVTAVWFQKEATGTYVAGTGGTINAGVNKWGGAGPGDMVTLLIDGVEVGSGVTGQYGAVDIDFVYPAAGVHKFTAIAGSHSDSYWFTSLEPGVEAADDGITDVYISYAVEGGGSFVSGGTETATVQTMQSTSIRSGKTVSLVIDGIVVGSGKTNYFGAADIHFVLPAAGVHSMTATAGSHSAPSRSFTTVDVEAADDSVTAVAFAAPAAGLVGTSSTVKVKVAKSTPILSGTTVTLLIDGVVIESKQTSNYGTVEFGFSYQAAGVHTMTVKAGSKSQSKPFTVLQRVVATDAPSNKAAAPAKAVTAKLTKLKSVKAKKTETIAGSFGTASGKVKITVTDPKGKVTTKTVSLNSKGAFNYKYTTAKKGSYTVRYSYLATPKYYGAKSYKMTFTAK